MLFSNTLTNISSGIDFAVCLIATVLNVIVLVASFYMKPFANIDILLILILSIIDISYTTFSVISTLVEWISPTPLLTDGSILCWLEAIFTYTFVLNNVCILSILALIRYFHIVRGHKISYWKTFFITLFILAFNFSFMIGDFVISDARIMPVGNYCLPRKKINTTDANNFITAFNVILVGKLILFLAITYFSYIHIILHHYKQTYYALLKESNNNLDFYSDFSRVIKKHLFLIILKAFVMIVCYTVSVIPDIVTMIPYMVAKVRVTPIVDFICSLFRSFLPLFDGLFVLMLHNEILALIKNAFRIN